jgi:hypothetical protein
MPGRVRRLILERMNTIVFAGANRMLERGRVPCYIIVTPHLAHLAPLAAQNHGAGIQPVFVANGIDKTDRDWLRTISPDVPIITLKTSFRGNSKSLLEHGIVINCMTATDDSEFCIQDADCFIFDSAFWRGLTLNLETHYAAGPFLREAGAGKPEFPETFLLMLNASLLREYRQRYGITAETAAVPRNRARGILAEAGYPEGTFIDSFKNYYDTLQQFWIVASHEGFHYKVVPGDGETVFHLGGTSYLHADFSDLEHWDYWALNVQYFHLRLLEMPACHRFRERFRGLIDFHGRTDWLLSRYPEFAPGWRRHLSDKIIDATRANDLYGGLISQSTDSE